MKRRGIAARAGRVMSHELPDCGHAPALMDDVQVAVVRDFLMAPRQPGGSPRSRSTSRATI
jgi:hypothetical protein